MAFSHKKMRSKARETAFQYLYSATFGEVDKSLFVSIATQNKLDEEDGAFSNELIKKARENKDEIIEKIKSVLENFSWQRVFLTDKCILILGIAEMTYFDTPKKVCIDEYVTLATKYSAENSPNFVNGILAKFYGDNK